ncbi:MAG: hypothetical protein A3G18_02255 [Rhodospirillales bacterium RIFCSPLOWO2_12_FULL_58_28]|nr:MAG: hypothetical protein A3H92_06895 [Rhodospirillales bacterium RIFCSPLOWO2_02_FULL_58_16]OHC78877.1 MAG: hypothetical protein A3G18_02255 [Rhodospirillales bacterium RIFCSPLOWO2_12_FULL_58_28]
MYINWEENLSVGVAELDMDHKKLLAIMDDFFSACYAGQGTESPDKILDRLIEYTTYHFDKEEALLELHGYPGLDDQRKEHAKLVAQIERLANSLRGEAPSSVTNSTMKFLNNWLIDHIKNSDMRYTAYLNGMGVR